VSETNSFDFRPGLDGLDGQSDKAPLVSSSSFPELCYHGFAPVAYEFPQNPKSQKANIGTGIVSQDDVQKVETFADIVPESQAQIQELLDEIDSFEAAIKAGATPYTDHVKHLNVLQKTLNHPVNDRISYGDRKESDYLGYLEKIREQYAKKMDTKGSEQKPPVTEDDPGQTSAGSGEGKGVPASSVPDKPEHAHPTLQNIAQSGLLQPATSSGVQGGMLGYGVLKTYRQDWKKLGICLGRLISTICLAPGEVTRLAIIDWQRKASGTSHEAIDQTDINEEFSDQSRQIDEIKAGTASKIQEANSNNTQIGSNTTVSAGVSNPTWHAGVKSSLNVSHGVQASYASATSDLKATGSNRVDQITREMAQTQRSKRSTIVREVTQSEAERLSTRVVANYNQQHSLNLEYFEILQKYQVATENGGSQGCVFVPCHPLDFNSAEVRSAFAPQLFSIFQEDLILSERTADLIQFIYGGETEQDELIKGIQEAISADKKFIGDRQNDLDTLDSVLEKLNDLRLKISNRSSLQESLASLKSIISAADYRELVGRLGRGNSIDYYTSAVLKLGEKYEISRKELVRTIEDRRSKMQSRKRRLRNQQVSIQNIFAMNAGYFTQQTVMRMDPTELFCFLAKVQVTEAGSQSSLTLADMGVQPIPVGYSGNMIAFLFSPPEPSAPAASSALVKRLLGLLKGSSANNGAEPSIITLPTSGVFMEAVLGSSMAAEHVGTEYKDWRNHEHTIPILPPDIDSLASRDRSQETLNLEESGFGAQMQSMRQRALESISSLTDFVSQLDVSPSLPGSPSSNTKAGAEPDDDKPDATPPEKPTQTAAPGDGDGDGDGDGEGIETI
jgi:hypothetical protein